MTWECTQVYFLQKAMLFGCSLCGLLTPGAGGPAACGTSPLLGTPVAKPISKFLALLGLCVVLFPIKKNQHLSLLADILDNVLLNEGLASLESQPA